ncbi:guanine nucleotide exchange factor MSS4-like [Sciurus carolinensis]|uniref:guanine nucleotide exchange factor MSS4-like n=1 Tax=Sciurus carolinensis TaxID=30640 RepID=UPI001FB49970|nr:guanine nucleotide exchange factor MSS4-like [Sciurus carolinensis]
MESTRKRKAGLRQPGGSRVLQPGAALFSRLVDDVLIFEDVGFPKGVGDIKFLVCADCEIGPIGWHCLDDKDSFCVALEWVSQE